MRLDEFEERMLRGEMGPVRQRALEQQLQVAQFFDAEDFVEVQQAHIMADTEALGEAGVAWLERVAASDEDERRVLVPTITDPRGADFKRFEAIRQDPEFVEMERRADRAFRALGVLMTDTCINYQTIMPPVMGEHLAMGDTGVVIASNSVFGARSNYEGGPSALAAALTGRTPRYGFHLDRHRIGTTRFHLDARPRDLAEWGAVGAIVGREMRSYFEVPVIDGVDQPPTSDQLKHLGAAMASYGSTAMFHMVGVTPEAHDLTTVFDGVAPRPSVIDRDRIEAFIAGYQPTSGDGRLDVVVFAAPQLSLFELETLSQLIAGRRVHPATTVLIATSPEVKAAADRMGITAVIEAAGAIVLEGVCFYQMHARELGEANGWERLMTNSAKLANIIGGYGYDPVLAPMDHCIDCACDGRVT